MSKLTEYLALIPKGIKDIDKIVVAITNNVRMEYGLLPKEAQDIIIGRRAICSTCPFHSFNAPTSEEYLQTYGRHYETDRLEEHCSSCGCPLHVRTAALTKNCGLEAWNEANPTLPQKELKWLAESIN